MYQAKLRADFYDIKSVIFRILSGSLILYLLYQFCQDEKNIEDLKEVVDHGIHDLFEYGQDFMVGSNTLASTNSTVDEKTYTFAEKIKK